MHDPTRHGAEPPYPNDPNDPDDRAGAQPVWRSSRGLLAATVALVGAGAVLWWAPLGAVMSPPAMTTASPVAGSTASAVDVASLSPAQGSPDAAIAHSRRSTRAAATAAPATGSQVPAGTVAAMPPSPRIVRQRDPGGDLTPDLADHVNEGEMPTMGEVIARLQAAGVRSGLGAFNPPGTRPPLIGLAVPEGFDLPAGYVRHYQATDDGQRVEPILMFAPGSPLPGAGSSRATLAADRVVPPELAPAGMPIRRIELPASPGGQGRAH